MLDAQPLVRSTAEGGNRLLDPILFGTDPTVRSLALRKLARWQEADAADAESDRARPPRFETWISRSHFYLGRSEMAKAASAISEAVRLQPEQAWCRTRQILTLILVGDPVVQRRADNELLGTTLETTDPSMANQVAWTCVLLPFPAPGDIRPVELAELALKGVSG